MFFLQLSVCVGEEVADEDTTNYKARILYVCFDFYHHASMDEIEDIGMGYG